jgi:4-carboxymuconolactone decarboxylase
MARLPLVSAGASPEVGAVYAEIMRSRGHVLNVFRALGHAPEGLRRLAALGEYVRFHTGLGSRLRELATLATASGNGSQYEWTQHVPLARAAGVTDAEMAAIAAGQVPPGIEGPERAAVGYLLELARDRRVSDETFAELRAHFDARQVTELTLLAAHYTALGLTLEAFAVELEPGQAPLLSRPAGGRGSTAGGPRP